MQGRLVPPEGGRFQSFPREHWRQEFPDASAVGLDTIEWIYDAYGEDVNPLATDAGIAEMRRLCALHQVAIESVCADWFMDFPLVGADPIATQIRWQRLGWLMDRCAIIGVKRMVVPFVDASAIGSQQDMIAVAAGILSLAPVMDQTKVELHLETALSPADFADLLARAPHRGIKVNYDSGNSASLGYRPQEEFSAYGARVGSVHLKDRKFGGGTVPLGEGDTDFDALVEALAAVGYPGDFILQAARGDPGDEIDWARHNVKFARTLLRRLVRP